MEIYSNDYNIKTGCTTPCTKSSFHTKRLYSSPKKSSDIRIELGEQIQVTKSYFSISTQTFIVRLGGSIAGGRTMLWALLSFQSLIQGLCNLWTPRRVYSCK